MQVAKQIGQVTEIHKAANAARRIKMFGKRQKQVIGLVKSRGGAINTYDAQTSIAQYGAGYVSVVSSCLNRLANRGVLKTNVKKLSKTERVNLKQAQAKHPRASAWWVLNEKYLK